MARFAYVIPGRVRRGAVRVVRPYGVTAENVVEMMETSIGFATQNELEEALRDKLGQEAADEFDRKFQEAINNGPLLNQVGRERSDRLAEKYAEETLAAVPDHVFTAALERGVTQAVDNAYENGRDDEARERTMHEINDLFASNAVPFAFGENGEVVATGSVTVSALALQPALDALEDSRLADARRHLLDAQRRLNENRPDKAVDDARFAVEHAMLAVLDATDTPRA
jgi:hypothetical protein